MEWQPIETAPRDGTLILVSAAEDGGDFEIYQMRWGAIQKNPLFAPGVVGMWVAPSGFTWREGKYGPTHWMPLPAPPSP